MRTEHLPLQPSELYNLPCISRLRDAAETIGGVLLFVAVMVGVPTLVACALLGKP